MSTTHRESEAALASQLHTNLYSFKQASFQQLLETQSPAETEHMLRPNGTFIGGSIAYHLLREDIALEEHLLDGAGAGTVTPSIFSSRAGYHTLRLDFYEGSGDNKQPLELPHYLYGSPNVKALEHITSFGNIRDIPTNIGVLICPPLPRTLLKPSGGHSPRLISFADILSAEMISRFQVRQGVASSIPLRMVPVDVRHFLESPIVGVDTHRTPELSERQMQVALKIVDSLKFDPEKSWL